MYYKKSYAHGHLGLKGNQINGNKILGHSKNVVGDTSDRVVSAIHHETEKKSHNYLEKK